MNPSPFLASYLIDWLTTQTMDRARQAVVDEVKSRVESGNLGDYDGILFKDSFQSKNATERISADGVEIGVVGATKRELVGLLDKMGTPKTTKGGSFKYYTGVWKGVKIAIIETGEGAERARQGVEALLQAFRPARVVSLGFAAALGPDLKSGALFTPNRLVLENGATLDLAAPELPKPRQSESVESGVSNELDGASQSDEPAQTETSRIASASSFAIEFLRRFSSGALLSVDREVGKKSEKKALYESTGASACDRSAWAIADVCGSRGVPLLTLRVLYEPNAAVQGVSREAAQFARNSNQSAARSLGAFFGAVMKKPGAALDVLKLKGEALAAADKLANALETILRTSKPKGEKTSSKE